MTTYAARRIRHSVLSFLIGILVSFEGNSYAASNYDSSPSSLCAVGNKVYFSAEDNIHGRELWVCDKSGKCSLIADLKAGFESSEPTSLIATGEDYLYFQACLDESKPHLFFLNTKREEPTDFSQSAELPEDRTIERFYAIEDQVYLLVKPETGNLEVWTAPPGSLSCTRVLVLNYGPTVLLSSRHNYIMSATPHRVSCIDSENLFFLGEMGNLEYTLNIPSGFQLLRLMGSLSGDGQFMALGSNNKYGDEPVLIDTKAGDIVFAKDIFPGISSSGIDQEVVFGNRMFFAADDSVHGSELWCSDGSSQGTFMVCDVSPGKSPSSPYKLCPVGSTLYFAANDGLHGQELWATDGTEAGTQMVADLTPGIANTNLWSFAPFKNQLLFCAEVPGYGEEVFIANNRSESPRLLKDIVRGPQNSGPHNIVPVGDYFVFTCDDGIHGEELWISDGSESGTRLATDIAVPVEALSSNPKALAADGDRLFFSALDLEQGREPWISDGTEAGTIILCDIYPGKTGSDPGPFIKCGKDIFFPATSPKYGRELWKSQGSPSTTSQVSDIRIGPDGASINNLVEVNGSLFFTADDGFHGQGLWSLKASTDVPVLVLDFKTSNEDMSITDIFSFWNNLYLYIRDVSDDVILYRFSEENASLTLLPKKASNIREFIRGYASVQDSPVMDESIIYFIRPPAEGRFSYTVLPTEQHTIFFSSHTPENGVELWKTDRTVKGTTLVRDIYPGPPSSGPEKITSLDNTVYFIAEYPGEGRVLFYSEGTESSTTPVMINQESFIWPPLLTSTFTPFEDCIFVVTTLPPRAGISGAHLLKLQDMGITNRYAFFMGLPSEPEKWPRDLTATEAGLFFVYQDDKFGTELWITDATLENTRMVKDINRLR